MTQWECKIGNRSCLDNRKIDFFEYNTKRFENFLNSRAIKKPICVIMTSLVLILGTFAIALPYQEAEANDVVCDVTITLKKKGAITGVPFQVILNNCANNSILTFNNPTRFDKLFERCVSSGDFPIFITSGGGHFSQYNCKGPFTIEIFALPTGAHNVNPAVLVVT